MPDVDELLDHEPPPTSWEQLACHVARGGGVPLEWSVEHSRDGALAELWAATPPRELALVAGALDPAGYSRALAMWRADHGNSYCEPSCGVVGEWRCWAWEWPAESDWAHDFAAVVRAHCPAPTLRRVVERADELARYFGYHLP